MKRILFTLILIAVMALPVVAQNINIYARPNSNWLSGTLTDPAWNWMKYADPLIGAGSSVGTGSIFYVDSNVTNEGDGSSWSNAVDTVAEASALCTANSGDQVRIAQGHVESGTGASMWGTVVAGTTYIHEGYGSDQGTYTFADTDAAINVGVASVTVIGGRYLAGISEVVAGFILDGSADYFTIINAEFPEPTTSSFEFNIAIQLTTGTDNFMALGCVGKSADAVGADHFINGGAGAVNGMTLIGNTIHGEYAIAPIFSDQADLETYISGNRITQLTASQFGIEFTAAATGIVADNRVNSTVLFEVDPGSMAYWKNMEGDTLPEGVSLTGQLGAFTGPAAGAAQDDNVKASLDLVHNVAEASASTVLTTIVNGNNNIFTVSGTIQIIEIVGIVTTGIEAKGCLINYNMDPTSPAGDTVFGTDGAAVEINGDLVGNLYTWDGVIANDLTSTVNGVALGMPAPTLIVPAGSLECAAVVATSATGAITFTIRYKPLTPGATVVSNSS